MATEATPGALRFNDGLGLAFPEREYIAYDPFDGDRDVDIRCRTVKLAKARKEHSCMGIERGGSHTIFPGELHRHERAIVDGEWRSYSVCVSCIDKWLTEIGRTPASPNVAGNRLIPAQRRIMTTLYRTCHNCAFSRLGESNTTFCHNDLLPSKHPEPIFFAVLKICDNDRQNWKASMGKPVGKEPA